MGSNQSRGDRSDGVVDGMRSVMEDREHRCNTDAATRQQSTFFFQKHYEDISQLMLFLLGTRRKEDFKKKTTMHVKAQKLLQIKILKHSCTMNL